MKLLDRFFLFINSKDRAVGAPNELTITVPDILRRTTGPNDIVRVYIQSFQIPNDFSRITPANSTFVYNGSPKTIPIGNPNVFDIQTSLRGQGVQVTYNRATNRFTYPAGTYDFSASTSAATILGFQKQVYTLSQGQTSPRPVDVTPTTTLYINSNFATRNYKVVRGQLSTTTIFSSCPIVAPPYGMIIYQDIFGQNSAWQLIEQLDTLRIWLTDDNDSLVELDSEWTMTIALEKYQDDGTLMLQELRGMNTTLNSQLDVSKTQLVYKDLKNEGIIPRATRSARAVGVSLAPDPNITIDPYWRLRPQEQGSDWQPSAQD
jgi:hypothetical protein